MSKTTEATVKSETPAITKDVFGSRPGTIHANINVVLLEHAKKKPISMKEIMELSGAEQTHYNHMKALERKGFIMKTAPGRFQLADGVKGKKASAPKAKKGKKKAEDAATNPDSNGQPATTQTNQEDAPVAASGN